MRVYHQSIFSGHAFRVLSIFLVSLVLFSSSMENVHALDGTDPGREAEAAAIRLQALSLFAGTGNGFDLYRSGTRAEGAVMLVRLLGRSGEAVGQRPTHPFRDVPQWATGSVELLWKMGLTSGVSADRFDATGTLTGRQYGTFLLRALGHGDMTAETYEQSIMKMMALGLLSPSDPVALAPDAPITRASMVILSEQALSIRKGTGTRTLLDTLVIGKQVPADAAGRWLAARLAPVVLGNAKSGYDRAKALHDWLVLKNQYGWLSAEEDPTRSLSAEAYTALSFGKGVCGAYAEAMLFLCEEAGIAASIVTGRANGTSGWTGHAWNQVRIDGAWYHTDVTFDDPVGTEVLRYNYFHVTDADISRDHTWDRTAWPACTSTAANWFVRNGLTVSSFVEFKDNVHSLVERRGTEITLRATPFAANVYSSTAIKGVLTQTGVVVGYTQSLDEVMGVIRLTDLRYAAGNGG